MSSNLLKNHINRIDFVEYAVDPMHQQRGGLNQLHLFHQESI